MADPRHIPSIDALSTRPAVALLTQRHGRRATVAALRSAADAVRRNLAAGQDYADIGATIEEEAATRLSASFTPSLRPVINATGVIIHTNLGRAPLSERAIRRIEDVAAGYSNLEYDVDAGRRGQRHTHAERLICQLTGADAACVVNNNAAATLLTLAALAAGREAIVSRGELVEIGGGFRVPDVMAQSGAILREVGTTNRTRTADYAAAISDRTAVILRVHPSNFRIEGFTERPALRELIALGRRFDIPVIDDLGSGLLEYTAATALRDEPTIADTILEGATVVMFSGDKLLGGPQAGIIAGERTAIEKIRRHPLMRALRVDKMTYAALEATLIAYAADDLAGIPVWQMLHASAEDIANRARPLAGVLRIGDFEADVIDGESTIGGGSAPGATLPTALLRLRHRSRSANILEQQLRQLEPPVIARIQDGCVVLDLRTVLPHQDAQLGSLLASLTTDGR